jgi:hypothetical protein
MNIYVQQHKSSNSRAPSGINVANSIVCKLLSSPSPSSTTPTVVVELSPPPGVVVLASPETELPPAGVDELAPAGVDELLLAAGVDELLLAAGVDDAVEAVVESATVVTSAGVVVVVLVLMATVDRVMLQTIPENPSVQLHVPLSSLSGTQTAPF